MRANWLSFTGIVRSKDLLFHDHPIAATSAEDFGRVHLFGFGGRDDEHARCGGTRNVSVFIDSIPEQRCKCFGAVITHILMLIPGTPPDILVVGTGRVLWNGLRN